MILQYNEEPTFEEHQKRDRYSMQKFQATLTQRRLSLKRLFDDQANSLISPASNHLPRRGSDFSARVESREVSAIERTKRLSFGAACFVALSNYHKIIAHIPGVHNILVQIRVCVHLAPMWKRPGDGDPDGADDVIRISGVMK